LILAVLSGYSVVALNLVYDIPFEWYSKYEEGFSSNKRSVSFYELSYRNKNIKPHIEIISKNASSGEGIKRVRKLFNLDFDKYIYLYCTLGEQTQIDSNIKIQEMAQRGNTIEVIVAINMNSNSEYRGLFYPEDIIRIDKKYIKDFGKTIILFKNQYGVRMSELYLSSY
jgi:hypothetical protein